MTTEIIEGTEEYTGQEYTWQNVTVRIRQMMAAQMNCLMSLQADVFYLTGCDFPI